MGAPSPPHRRTSSRSWLQKFNRLFTKSVVFAGPTSPIVCAYHELADHEKTPVNLDAVPEHADWSKKKWDLGGPKRIEWVLYNIIAVRAPKRPGAVQERLDAFMTTPAGQAMPEEHRARLRDLGYTVGPKS